ncbi:hypothetical protein [Oceanivirga salmonicida]|uniref:hypothetical protein n=1 Tax=Oceanivirga salmonicida TaxID=1769291 RepID=UPI00082F2BF6|nr:hypothetical protein [Oceanivirga salmonicida]
MKLKKSKNVNDIIAITQVKYFEDEIVYSTNINNIKDLLNSKSNKDFKKDFIKCNNVLTKLKDKDFSIIKFWSREDSYFAKYKNRAEEIKIIK